MNFGAMEMPQLNKHSLDTLNFPRGILVFLLGLVFFLGSTEQYKAMKIGITFFGSKLDLLCISKVLTIFCEISKIRWKRKHSRGHVACSPSALGWSLGVGFSGAAYSERTREGLSVWGLSVRCALGKFPGWFFRRGTRDVSG